MQTFKYALIILVLLGIGGFLVSTSEKPSKLEDFVINTSPEVIAKQLCYIWNTEAGDKAMISMDIREENTIGEFYLSLAGEQTISGIFRGVVSPVDEATNKRSVNALWQVISGENQLISELVIIFDENGIAAPGFGEMADRGDGVYAYTDPTNIYFPISLQQTDCGDEAMD